MRPRWKNDVAGEGALHEPDADAEPDTGQGERRRARSAPSPGSRTPSSSRPVSDQTSATAPAASTKASVTSSEAPRANVSASPAPTSVTDAANAAAALRWPRHRATSTPGSRTTSVAAASRTQSPNPVSGRSREMPEQRHGRGRDDETPDGIRARRHRCRPPQLDRRLREPVQRAGSRSRHGTGAQALPRDDDGSGQGDRDGDEEEEEAGREGLVGRDAEGPEEAHEERFPHRQAVDRERHEHDEEEQRPHHVVRPRRKVDSDRLPGAPDREHARRLHDDREREHPAEQPQPRPVRVQREVHVAQDRLDAQPVQHRDAAGAGPDAGSSRRGRTRPRRSGRRTRARPRRSRRRSSDRGRARSRRRRAASVAAPPSARSSSTVPATGPARAGMAPRGLVDPRRVAAERGRQHLGGGVGDERRPHEPAEPLVHAARGEQPAASARRAARP